MEKCVITHFLEDTTYSQQLLDMTKDWLKKGKYDVLLDEAESVIRGGLAEGGMYEASYSSGRTIIKIERGDRKTFGSSLTGARFYVVRITKDGVEFPFCYKFGGDAEQNLEYIELYKNAPELLQKGGIILTEKDSDLDPGPAFEQRNFRSFAKNNLDAVLEECEVRISRSEKEIPNSLADLKYLKFIIKDYKRRTAEICPPLTPVVICVNDPRTSNAIFIGRAGENLAELRWRDQNLKKQNLENMDETDKRLFYGPIPSDMVFKFFYLFAERRQDKLIGRDEKNSMNVDETIRTLISNNLVASGLPTTSIKYYDNNGQPLPPWGWNMSDGLSGRREDIQAHVGFVRYILKRRDHYVKKIKKIRDLKGAWVGLLSQDIMLEPRRQNLRREMVDVTKCLHKNQIQLDVGYKQTDGERVLHGLDDVEHLNVSRVNELFKDSLDVARFWYQRIHNKTLDKFANQEG